MLSEIQAQNKILITTSHRPTKGMRTLCNDLAHSIPIFVRINRGKMSLHELGEKAASFEASKIAVIDRSEGGGAGTIRFLEINGSAIKQVAPQIRIGRIRFRREFGKLRNPIHSLFVETSPKDNAETKRLQERLSEFLSMPMITFEKGVGKYSAFMRIFSSSSGTFLFSVYYLPKNIEIGPQITISSVEWKD